MASRPNDRLPSSRTLMRWKMSTRAVWWAAGFSWRESRDCRVQICGMRNGRQEVLVWHVRDTCRMMHMPTPVEIGRYFWLGAVPPKTLVPHYYQVGRTARRHQPNHRTVLEFEEPGARHWYIFLNSKREGGKHNKATKVEKRDDKEKSTKVLWMKKRYKMHRTSNGRTHKVKQA